MFFSEAVVCDGHLEVDIVYLNQVSMLALSALECSKEGASVFSGSRGIQVALGRYFNYLLLI